jgi:CRISPR/Cas system CSM-associated protein Csm2 small subunit
MTRDNSYSKGRPYPNRNYPDNSQNTKELININTKDPMKDIVKKILEEDNSNKISDMLTSGTSYRKLHDVMASILDNAINLKPEDAKVFLSAQLPRARILVDYQKERKLITEQLKEIIDKVIDDLYNSKPEDLSRNIENTRIFIDSLAVLAKRKE